MRRSEGYRSDGEKMRRMRGAKRALDRQKKKPDARKSGGYADREDRLILRLLVNGPQVRMRPAHCLARIRRMLLSDLARRRC